MTTSQSGKRTRIGAVIAIFLLAGLGATFVLSSHRADNDRPPVPTDEDFIAEAVALNGLLWLRGDGKLFSVDLKTYSRRRRFEMGVQDVAVFKGQLWVLRVLANKSDAAAILVWNGVRFDERYRLSYEGDNAPFAIVAVGGSIVVVAPHTISVASNGRQSLTQLLLSKNLNSYNATAAAPLDGHQVYVGANVGEWGGGLQSVDLRTGQVSSIERGDAEGLCAEPLNGKCDPVTSIIPDPQHPKCVIASIGLVHFLSSGRILRICDKDVEVVFEKILNQRGRSLTTEPIFDLKNQGTGYWAVSPRRLYYLQGDSIREFKYPDDKVAPGIRISKDIPGVLVLTTAINGHVSLSGYTPLIAITGGAD
jgi:hypothetical protein